MTEAGPVARALLEPPPYGTGDQALARHICQACVDGLDIDGAGLSVLTTSVSRETLWATDPTAQQLEDLQFGLGEGACMQAARTGLPVLVADLRDSSDIARWPIFAAAVAEQTTARALFALPLQWGVINLGVLDLYRNTPGGLGPDQWRDALGAADIAAWLMLNQRTEPDTRNGAHPASEEQDGAADGFDHSLGRRDEVHQATGMVLVQLGVPATEALARLRGHAFAERRMLTEVAHDVVRRRLAFSPDSD